MHNVYLKFSYFAAQLFSILFLNLKINILEISSGISVDGVEQWFIHKWGSHISRVSILLEKEAARQAISQVLPQTCRMRKSRGGAGAAAGTLTTSQVLRVHTPV